MGILKGRIEHPQNPKRSTEGNIFLDSGSDKSYITEDCARRLGLPVIGRREVIVNSFDCHGNTKSFPVTHIRLVGKDGETFIEAFITRGIKISMKTDDWSATARKLFPEYVFTQFEENPFCIDILLGMDHLYDVSTEETRQGFKIKNSIFGVYLEGSNKAKHNGEITNTYTAMTDVTPIEDYDYNESDFEINFEDLEAQFEKSLEKEDFTAEEDRQPSEEEVLIKFMEGIQLVETSEGHKYEVPFLWKQGDESKKKLKSNFGMALKFLHQLRDRLKAKGMLEEADKVIDTSIARGIYEVVENNPSIGHHIPSLFVEQPHSTTTPLRHVLGANMGKPCINSELEIGPSLIACLPTVLRRFRCGETGITADIHKAFNQLIVKFSDRDYMRMLWIHEGKLVTIRPARVPFGLSSAPFKLFATLKKHLEGHESPEAISIMMNLYSDNLATALDESELDFCLKAVSILGEGGFELKKFSTNNKELAKELEKRNLLNMAEAESTRILGMKWDLNEDTLSFCPVPDIREDEVITLRSIMKRLPRHYDPLGIQQCVTMVGTKFQSDLQEKGSGPDGTGYKMDQPLSQEDADKWRTIYSEIQKSSALKIPRYHRFDKNRTIRVHVMVDASMQWGGAIGYLTQSGKSVVVAGKTKMPEKRLREANVSVPRRELLAAVIGSKLMSKLLETYKPKYKSLEPHLWSDSTTVLSWIANNEPKERFVQNRINLIQNLVPDIPWHYIETESNPADYMSRGLLARDYLNPSHPIWRGPDQMHQDILQPYKEEADPLSVLAMSTSTEPTRNILNLVNEALEHPRWPCTTLNEVKHRLAAALKVTRKLYIKAALKNNWDLLPPISSGKIAGEVSRRIIRAEQEQYFKTEIDYLKFKTGPVPMKVRKMSLFLDKSSILRVGGRLTHASIGWAQKYPILLSRDSSLIPLRIQEFHETMKHGGPGLTRTALQQLYWIPRVSRLISRVISKCFKCRKATGPPLRPPGPPALPPERATLDPMAVIGVDLTGHFNVKGQNNQITKVYLAFFTCCSMRYINIELMDNMSSECFLLAFRRHCSQFITPLRIWSDNATYFVKAAEVLGEELGDEFLTEVAEKMNHKGIDWRKNLASAPWQGGHFERLIGVVKLLLKRICGRQVLQRDELWTLSKEAQAICNERPYGVLPTNHKDRTALSPNLVMFGRSLNPLPYGDNNIIEEDEEVNPMFNPDGNLLETLGRRHGNRIAQFRKQFVEEYFNELRQRHINDYRSDPTSEANIKKGNLVIIHSDIKKRSLWELAEVIAPIKSQADGKVRGAKLWTKEGITTRPLQKLCPLLDAEQLRPYRAEIQPENITDETDENTEQQEPENIEQPESENTEEAYENAEQEESERNDNNGPREVNVPDTQSRSADAIPTTSAQLDSTSPERPSRASKTKAREFLQRVSQDLLEDD